MIVNGRSSSIINADESVIKYNERNRYVDSIAKDCPHEGVCGNEDDHVSIMVSFADNEWLCSILIAQWEKNMHLCSLN